MELEYVYGIYGIENLEGTIERTANIIMLNISYIYNIYFDDKEDDRQCREKLGKTKYPI